MIIDDAIDIQVPAPDGQYRLKNCKVCRGDNVAYIRYRRGDGEAFRTQCFDCGYTVDNGHPVKHDAQVAWNGGCEGNELTN